MKVNSFFHRRSGDNYIISKVVIAVAIVIFATFTGVKAQNNPNTRWSFVYADRFPH
jgi:hypothetical protein